MSAKLLELQAALFHSTSGGFDPSLGSGPSVDQNPVFQFLPTAEQLSRVKHRASAPQTPRPVQNMNEYSNPPDGLPIIIREKDLAARQKTMKHFLGLNDFSAACEDFEKKDSHEPIDRNASIKLVNNLSNIAHANYTRKKNQGLMLVNELWGKKYHKTLVKATGLRDAEYRLKQKTLKVAQERINDVGRYYEEKHQDEINSERKAFEAFVLPGENPEPLKMQRKYSEPRKNFVVKHQRKWSHGGNLQTTKADDETESKEITPPQSAKLSCDQESTLELFKSPSNMSAKSENVSALPFVTIRSASRDQLAPLHLDSPANKDEVERESPLTKTLRTFVHKKSISVTSQPQSCMSKPTTPHLESKHFRRGNSPVSATLNLKKKMSEGKIESPGVFHSGRASPLIGERSQFSAVTERNKLSVHLNPAKKTALLSQFAADPSRLSTPVSVSAYSTHSTFKNLNQNEPPARNVETDRLKQNFTNLMFYCEEVRDDQEVKTSMRDTQRAHNLFESRKQKAKEQDKIDTEEELRRTMQKRLKNLKISRHH